MRLATKTPTLTVLVSPSSWQSCNCMEVMYMSNSQSLGLSVFRCRSLELERHERAALVVRSYHRKPGERSEEHTSELQSLMRISYAVFCLKKKKKTTIHVPKQSVTLTPAVKNKI